ncbi:hypothetical protein BGW36DRAFT_356105 [Talaromyces proteolyticus]|uniref:Uncharacterized protein n=1 Tax=Talaromyces proteolyticus TaxID=1131652 RepID=A0AAD4Q3N3_9EURO|nr:uncharacterized protein BGW36DRAFT_356105 [Talaromyces proteolyticus]KAH8701961.1 hypothetical protein BGW36DRAFT_356105 [Talaromyces proteolyticus]
METSMVHPPQLEGKSHDHDEPLQLHSMPTWKRYESEEEEVSETSSVRAFTPSDAESGNDDTADSSASEAEYGVVIENGMPSPSQEVSDESSSIYSRRLSVVTAKRASAVTYYTDGRMGSDDSAREYVTPPLSPSSVPFLGGEEEEEEEQQVFEAKKVQYTAPTMRPNIIFIQNPESPKRPENLRKRSSTASGLSSPDRSKRYSAMFFRDISQDGEVAYVESQKHVRARSAQRVGSSPYRSRGTSPAKGGNANADAETRPQWPRRNTSLRSTGSVYMTPSDEVPRARSRPRSIRSSGLASDQMSSSSRSSKQLSTHNSSTSSLHNSSTFSFEPCSPDSADKTKSAAPHPLSIITTLSPAPIQFTGPFGTTENASGLTPHARSASTQSDIDPTYTPCSPYSPMEPQNSQLKSIDTTPQILRPGPPGLYGLRHNPSLTLVTRPEDLEPSSADPHQPRRFSRDWSISSPASAKPSSKSANGTSAMKSLMGGFRGLGRPRKRSLAPAPNQS